MKVINAGLVLIIIAICFFSADSIRLNRIRQVLFERANININMDLIVSDVLYEAIEGIDENGEAVISLKRADMTYAGLVGMNIKENAADCTAFMVYTGDAAMRNSLEKILEKEASAQIKNVNKRLNYSLLFTEKTNSFFYNPIVKDSLYIMYLPKSANLLRLKSMDLVYTLSGAGLK